VVTDLGVIIVRCSNLSVVRSLRIPGVLQLYCRSIDSGTNKRQLLLTYLTDDGIVYAVNIDGKVLSNRVSPTHGCSECTAKPCFNLVQDKKDSAAFIAFQEKSLIFFSHTPDMVWISKPQPLDANGSGGDLSYLFEKWNGEMRKRPNS
jgi:hypothetical protein